MLRTLESQIHFVQEMQRVDTTGVEPLRSVRDESAAAVKETTIGLDRLKDAFAKERVSGRRRRVQRVSSARNGHPEEAIWKGNALDSASKKKGPYFVVETGSSQSS
jgi:Asp-tRNA(Asn)/Glu-tRNA(Gln) amidotransferase C subunit